MEFCPDYYLLPKSAPKLQGPLSLHRKSNGICSDCQLQRHPSGAPGAVYSSPRPVASKTPPPDFPPLVKSTNSPWSTAPRGSSTKTARCFDRTPSTIHIAIVRPRNCRQQFVRIEWRARPRCHAAWLSQQLLPISEVSISASAGDIFVAPSHPTVFFVMVMGGSFHVVIIDSRSNPAVVANCRIAPCGTRC